MQIVIEIPDHYYENNIKKELPIILSEDNIIALLPKGHGTLDDADELSKQAETPLEYLETAYTGARACDDVEEQVRLARAIAAYKHDVHEDCAVLDKIRAEIEQMDFDFGDYYDNTETIIEMVCKVIDKYKAESEE